MTEDQLPRRLQSVGMACFVRYLPLFDSGLGSAEIAARLEAAEPWSAISCRTRTSTAKAILAAGLKAKALALVAQSRLPESIRAAARAAR